MLLQSEFGFSQSARSTELVCGAEQTSCEDVNKINQPPATHLQCYAVGRQAFEQPIGILFVHHPPPPPPHPPFIQCTRIAFISQRLCSMSSHARQRGLGARHPSPPLHGGRDGRQQVLLGETQQVTVNGHVAKGDAQQAAGPRRGMPSHRFRLAFSGTLGRPGMLERGATLTSGGFFCFAFLVLGAGGKGLF